MLLGERLRVYTKVVMRNVSKLDDIREKSSMEYECGYRLNLIPTSTYLSSATLVNSSGLQPDSLDFHGLLGVNAPLQKTLNRGTNHRKCSSYILAGRYKCKDCIESLMPQV
jgi:hypothetical protein